MALAQTPPPIRPPHGTPPSTSDPSLATAHYAPPPPPPGVAQMDLATVVGRTLLIGFCSGATAVASGALAGVLAFLSFSSDGDPGEWEGLGSILGGIVVFMAIGFIVYNIAATFGVRRFLPRGRRLIPALALTLPAPLFFVSQVVMAST